MRAGTFVDATCARPVRRLRGRRDEVDCRAYPLDSQNESSPDAPAGVIEKGFAYRASPERLEEEGYNLNIARYVDTFEAEATIDLTAVQQRLETTEAELAKVRAKMREFLNLIKA